MNPKQRLRNSINAVDMLLRVQIGGADRPHSHHSNGVSDVLQNGGVELGPIGMTVGGADRIHTQPDLPVEKLSSIHSMTTEQWEAKYMKADGTVDLWMEEEFNAGSRLVVSAGMDTCGGMPMRGLSCRVQSQVLYCGRYTHKVDN